jgi:O-antigen/teichoic acid export membrane protein
MISNLHKSRLFQNTGIYILTSIISAAIPFLLLPILTRYLSPEDYGIATMFSVLITLVSPFIGVNVNGAISRQYYEREQVDIWSYVGNCFYILLTSTILFGTIFFMLADTVSKITSFPTSMFWIVIVYSFSYFINSILLSIWQVQKLPLLYGGFQIAQTLLNLILSLIFITTFKFGWQGRVYGQFVAVVIFSALSLITLIRNKWIKFDFNIYYIKNALYFGIPLIPHALSGIIMSTTDRLMIANMVGLSATGIYTVGYQVGSIINLFAVSFNNAYVPWLYEKLKKDNYSTKVKIVKFTYLYFVLIIIGAIVLGLTALLFLKYVLGKSFIDSSFYVIWIALGYAFQGMYFMVVNYIFYGKKTTKLAWITFISAIINIVLNYFFIRKFGAIGAAQATSLVYLLKFMLVWYFASKVHEMPWKLSKAKANFNNK